MTYDDAHGAWDAFIGEGRVPNGCSQPDPADNISAAINFPRPHHIPVHNAPSTPSSSRQHSQPALASPLFNAHYITSPSRGSPSPSTPAKAIRERSTVPPISTRQIPSGSSTAAAKSPLHDGSDSEGNWWVVITGTEPGVYHGRWVVLCSQSQSLI